MPDTVFEGRESYAFIAKQNLQEYMFCKSCDFNQPKNSQLLQAGLCTLGADVDKLLRHKISGEIEQITQLFYTLLHHHVRTFPCVLSFYIRSPPVGAPFRGACKARKLL